MIMTGSPEPYFRGVAITRLGLQLAGRQYWPQIKKIGRVSTEFWPEGFLPPTRAQGLDAASYRLAAVVASVRWVRKSEPRSVPEIDRELEASSQLAAAPLCWPRSPAAWTATTPAPRWTPPMADPVSAT